MEHLTNAITLLSAPLPATPETRAAAIVAVEAALLALDVQRSETHRQVAEGEEARRPLLLDRTDAGTRKLGGLDKGLAELRLDAERIEEIEPRLIDRLRAIEAEHQSAARDDLASAYLRGIEIWADAMHAATAARGHLVAIREHAVATGFERALGVLELPDQNFPTLPDAIERFASGARGTLGDLRTRPPKPETFPVRFIQAAGLYNTGEVAAFDAAQAWFLVDNEIAAWFDPRRRPPRPASHRGGAQ